MKIRQISIIIISVGVYYACKQPYMPKVAAANTNYLVIEGLINTGPDSTIITLSRTVPVNNTVAYKPETGARVSVESDQGNSIPLTEAGNGKYFYPGLNQSLSNQYRLRIVTANNKTYLSDFVAAKASPPIDSLPWKAFSNYVQIYANTHDPAAKTIYYRWSFSETWQFHAKYQSLYKSVDTAVVLRNLPQDDIYTCFQSSNSTSIVLGTSLKLSKDEIYDAPVTTVPSTSEKVSIKYSILVKQYALTEDAFNFWTIMKKNTEELGSIFDTQPAELTGNVHNIADANEPVIGYVSAGTTSSYRIFINRSALPSAWTTTYPYNCDPLDTAFFHDPQYNGNLVAYYFYRTNPAVVAVNEAMANGNLVGYTYSSFECADCTIRGTKQVPSFWQ